MSNKVRLGEIGEKLVADLVNGVRFTDPYAMNGDLVDSNGSIVEVKTQVRWRVANAFTVDASASNQLPKCLSVDRLMFVEFDSTNKVKIWEAPARGNRDYDIRTTKYGKTMAAFPISSMTLIKTINDSDLASEMRSFSSGTI
jgi:hypothetical protein